MNHHRFPVVTLSLALICWSAQAAGQQIKLYFSPNGGAAHAIAEEINAAKKSIFVETYSISESEITDALIGASARGVPVRIIVDKHQQNDIYSSAPRLSTAGIRVVTDRVEALHHNKVMVIDDTVTITGSMNFTNAGNKENAENTLIIHDTTIAAAYSANWQKHNDHASTYHVVHHDDFKPKKLPPGLVPQLLPRPRKERQ